MHLSITEFIIVFRDFEVFLINYDHVEGGLCKIFYYSTMTLLLEKTQT